VWAQWLFADLNSPRFNAQLQNCLRLRNAAASLITSPNFADVQERSTRSALIRCQHPWMWAQDPFPIDPRWEENTVTPSELATWLFLYDADWLRFTAGTRHVGDLATSWLGRAPLRQANRDLRGDIDRAVKSLAAGWVPAPVLAVCAGGPKNPTVLIDGHVRAVAAVYSARPLEAIVGTAAAFASWYWYEGRR
jgi:hypothetical protein